MLVSEKWWEQAPLVGGLTGNWWEQAPLVSDLDTTENKWWEQAPLALPSPESESLQRNNEIQAAVMGEFNRMLGALEQAEPSEDTRTAVQRIIDAPGEVEQEMAAEEAGPELEVEIPEEIEPLDRSVKAWRSFKHGSLGMVDLVGGAAIWAGMEETGNELREYARAGIEDNYVKELYEEFTWEDLADPDFYATKGVAMIPSLLTLIPVAVGGGVAAGAVAGAAGLGALGIGISAAVGSALAARPLESAMEAMGTYNSLLDQGVPEEIASEQAADVFTKNMALVGMDAAQFALAFAKVPLPLRAGMAGWIQRKGIRAVGFAAGALSEGYEEVIQGYFQEVGQQAATGEVTIELLESMKLASPEAKEAFVLGTMGGLGFQTTGAIAKKLTTKDATSIIQEMIDQRVAEGEEEAEAAKAKIAKEAEVAKKAVEEPGPEAAPEKAPEAKPPTEKAPEAPPVAAEVAKEPEKPVEAVPPKEAEIGPEKAEKEPWEMTQGEFVETKPIERLREQFKKDDAWKGYHKEQVRQALDKGFTIPAEVLKDYPDLEVPSLAAAAEEAKPPAVEGPPEKGAELIPTKERSIAQQEAAKRQRKALSDLTVIHPKDLSQMPAVQAIMGVNAAKDYPQLFEDVRIGRRGRSAVGASSLMSQDKSKKQDYDILDEGALSPEFYERYGRYKDFNDLVELAQAEIQTYAETGKPPDPFASTEPEAEEEIVGLNVEESTRIRSELGLNDLDPADRRTWLTTLSEAKEGKTDFSALETADQLLKKNRPITDVEHAGMVLKAADLANEYDSAIRDINYLIEKGDRGAAQVARAQAESIIDNIDKLTEATRLGRRETARALSIGRMMISRETYDLVHVMQRAQAAKGKKLTAKETAQIEKITAEHAELQKALQKAEKDYTKLLADRDRLKATAIIESQIVKAKTKKFKVQTTLLAERESIKKQIAALGYRVNDITGLTAEGAYLVGKLAVNYIREGAITLPDVVKRVRGDVPELTNQDVYQSLIAKDPRRQAKARSDTARIISELKTQADLLLKIEKAEKGIFDLPKGQTPKAGEIRALQSQLRDLRSQAYKSGVHPAQLERAITTINELQDQLTNQYRTIRREKKVDPAELASAKEKIEALRNEMRVEDELAKLQEQMRTGDFVIKEKLPPKKVSPDLERKQIELKRVRRQIRVAIEEMTPITPKKVTIEAINTLRTLKATADMSATMRQGLVQSVRHPVMATKAFKKSFLAFFSEYSAEKVDNSIRSAEHHYIREKAGLQMTEVEASLSHREEMFMAQWIEKVPIIGDVVKASNRNMTTTLNLLRTGAFDYFLSKYPNATQAELSAWADWINITTGRGNLGHAAASANILSLGLFAPRFAVSRIQTPYMIFKYWSMPRVRSEIAKDLVALVGVGGTMLALAVMAGFDVGDDPRDPDFGKIRIGDTRIDIWGGLQQPIRVTARVGLAVTDRHGITGRELAERDKDVDPLELIGRFAAYKLAPSITIPLELIKGRTIVGEPVTPTQTAVRAVLPLWLEDVADAYRQEGAERAFIIGGLTFLGVGATTYEDSQFATRRRIRRMALEDNRVGAIQLKLEWNIRHPDKRIRKVSLK